MKNFLLLVAVAFVACNGTNANLDRIVAGSPTPTTTPALAAQQQPNDGVRRITTGELEELMKQGKVVVVDVRNQAAYDLGHIRGAKWIPVTQVGERTKELPRDKMIVTYCAWAKEQTSAGAAAAMKSQGYENVAALLGGYQLWEKEGRPVDKKK